MSDTQELATIQNELINLRQEYAELAGGFEEVMKEKKGLEANVISLKAEIEELEKEKTDCMDTLSQLSITRDKKITEIANLETYLLALQKNQ